jgi:SAM-dependent methyltransferase
MLDFGSGGGTYLGYFHGSGANISGAEISTLMVSQSARAGFDVRQIDDVHSIPFPDNEFDVVYLMQVFEHLTEPHRMMKEIHRVLRADGAVYLAVPNGQSFWRRVFGDNWISGWFAPFHIFVYDLGSLTCLAEAHGLCIEEHWSRTPESWFRLNLSAALDKTRGVVIGSTGAVNAAVIRFPLMVILRILELFTRQRDCVVVKMTKAKK